MTSLGPPLSFDTGEMDKGLPEEVVGFGLPVGEFLRLGQRALALAAEHVSGIRDRPVYRRLTEDRRALLMDQPLPDDGASPDAILSFIADHVLTHPMGNGHPRFFGWVNSPPAHLAILSELLATAMNPSCAGGDHAAIYLERCAVRWLMDLIGFPTSGSMGLLLSGGSTATIVGLAAARHSVAGADGWNVREHGLQSGHPRLVLYVSADGHTCIRKAAEILGLGADHVRVVPTDGEYRLDLGALAAVVAKDRVAGLRPFCVAASAGTIGTGAIDPLDAIADFCAAQALWLHVDGAYGAVGILDPAVAPYYTGLERAQSVALDPHKWLSVPVECGCVLVRDGELLRDAFSLVPSYVRTDPGKGIGGLPWYAEYGLQQTRGFRALKVWVTLMAVGRRGMAAHVIRHNRLARRLAAAVDHAPDLELLAPVALSIVCFRFVPLDWRASEADLDALNKAIMEAIQEEGEAFLTGAVLKGRFALRACVLHYATTEDDVAFLVALVRRVGARLARAGTRPAAQPPG